MFCLKFSTINKGIGVFVTFTVSSNHIWNPTESAETCLVLCQLVCREYDCRFCRFWTHKGSTSWESWESGAWAGVRAPGSTFPGRRGECSVHITKIFVSFLPEGNQNSHAKVTPQRNYNRKQCFYGILPHVYLGTSASPKQQLSPPKYSQVTAEDISKQGCNLWNAKLWVHTHCDFKTTTASSLPLLVDRHDGGFTATPDGHYGSKALYSCKFQEGSSPSVPWDSIPQSHAQFCSRTSVAAFTDPLPHLLWTPQTFRSYPPTPHFLLYSSPQLQQLLLTNPQTTSARETGWLAVACWSSSLPLYL